MTIKSLDRVCEKLQAEIDSQRQSLLAQVEAMRAAGELPEHIECDGFVYMTLSGNLRGDNPPLQAVPA